MKGSAPGLPAAVHAMASRGPRWQNWVDDLPRLLQRQLTDWRLDTDGDVMHGHASVVIPVRTDDGAAAVLKVGFPDDETRHIEPDLLRPAPPSPASASGWHEHLALRRWGGDGAVRLLSADPHRHALLLERLLPRNLTELWDVEACEIVAGLYAVSTCRPCRSWPGCPTSSPATAPTSISCPAALPSRGGWWNRRSR